MYAICTEFQKSYSGINLQFKKRDEKSYDYGILLLSLRALEGRYKAKIHKTTRKGTKVTCKLIKEEKDLEEYREDLQIKISEFNEKWSTDFYLI